MCFQGTARRSHSDISEAFDDVGGYFNAGTSREHTVFTVKVLAEDVEMALDVLSDVIINSAMNSKSIEKEKKVIEQEISQSDDNPDDAVFENFMTTAFCGDNLGKPILGSVKSINSFNQENLLAFYKKHYNASNIVMAVAGKIEPIHIQKIVSEKFASLIAGHTNKIDRIVSFNSEKTYVTRANLQQAHVVLGFEGLSYSHKDYFLQEIACNIFGGSASSRLFSEIREKRGLSYNVSSFTSSFVDCGIFGVAADVSMDKVAEFLQVVGDELKKIAENLSDKELERVRHQVKAAYLISKESIINRTSRLANNYIRHGRIVDTQEIVNKYLSYQKADVQDYFIKLVNQKDNYALSVLRD
jgi:predicted Zn-dependent peptidase